MLRIAFSIGVADDNGGDRGAGREGRVEQVGDRQAHRIDVPGPVGVARVAAHRAPRPHEGERWAAVRQEQLHAARARRAAQAWARAAAEAQAGAASGRDRGTAATATPTRPAAEA